MRLAIIPARGGSKRIPGKNVKPFLGRPIIEYSIKSAKDSEIFDEIMVSTDSDDIAELALRAGASVPFRRSSESSGDFATTAEVILEVLDKYRESGKEFDYACCIYPTAPFVTAKRLKNAMEILKRREEIQSVIPVVKFSFPPQRGLIIDEDGCAGMREPEYTLVRSQDIEPIYHDAGQFYMLRTKEFMKTRDIWGGKTVPLILSDLEVQDIDNPEDWKMAELKYSMMVEERDG